MVANTGEKEMEDLVRIHVADLGLPPYLELGPGLNALSGRPYYATDLYTNNSWPLGASLLGAPKPERFGCVLGVGSAKPLAPPHTPVTDAHTGRETCRERQAETQHRARQTVRGVGGINGRQQR